MNDLVNTLNFQLHLAATLFMTGLIWFVQIVHYPLLDRIDPPGIPRYEQAHTRRTRWLVGPPMFIEIVTGLLLVGFRPLGVSDLAVSAGILLLLVIGVSTQFLQIPCHEELSRRFDPTVYRRLVRTNWIRTIAWSLRSLLVMGMM